MMKINAAIPAKSLGYMLVCGGILLIVILGLVSLHRYNTGRAETVKKTQNQINEQKVLGPVFESLMKASEAKDIYGLPNPPRVKLTRQELDKFQDAVRQAALRAGMMNVTLLPDLKSAPDGSNLLYNATMKGDLSNYRRFMIALGAVPYVDQIEEINIKQFADAMEFKLKIGVALSN